MPEHVIYEKGDLRVLHDTEDSSLPIAYEVGGDEKWLTKDQAVEAGAAVAYALGVNSDDPAEVIRASQLSSNEGLLRLAAIHNKTVTFSYAKGDGSVIEQRRLIPGEVKEVKGHLTFVGYDPDRDDVRAYRVDRMKGEVSIA